MNIVQSRSSSDAAVTCLPESPARGSFDGRRQPAQRLQIERIRKSFILHGGVALSKCEALVASVSQNLAVGQVQRLQRR